VPATPAPAPWTITVPRGARAETLDNLADSMRASGLDVTRRGLTYHLQRRDDPPPCLATLQWRLAAGGVVGSPQTLRNHWQTWPNVPPLVDPTKSEDELRKFEQRSAPGNMLELAERMHAAERIMLSAANADEVVRHISRVANKLLEWYPNGQMVAWGVNYQHLAAGRPGHMLAAASAGGWGAVQRTLRDQRGPLWSSGEAIASSQPTGLYLNMVNGFDIIGVAVNTLPIRFIFEFGTNLQDEHPLDFLGVRYVHSVSSAQYLSSDALRVRSGPQPGLLQQDALREWFVQRFNAVADHLVRIENFRTRTGELRPSAMQDRSMHVNRILNVTAHLLASRETATRFSDFWDLFDLYGTLLGGLQNVFSEARWQKDVVPAMGSLPGDLARIFTQYATDLRNEWVAEVVDGVTDPKRRTKRTVRVGSGKGQARSYSAFFAKYIDVRRNTLHGYNLGRPDVQEFLTIHDGRLPVRLPEWGRVEFIALLANPGRLIDRLFLST
jgi:hypothetical protein